MIRERVYMETNKIVIAAVAVLVLLGGGIFLATRSDETETASNANTSQSQSQDSDSMEATPSQNIVEIASADEQFSTLVAAVQAAGLGETLTGEGPFTVFAPTNSAFDKLPAGTVEDLLKPENIETLKGILTYHVVSAKAMSTDLSDGQEITTVNGGILKVSIANGEVTLTDAKGGVSKVIKADIAATNGVVHVIDTVVMP